MLAHKWANRLIATIDQYSVLRLLLQFPQSRFLHNNETDLMCVSPT